MAKSVTASPTQLEARPAFRRSVAVIMAGSVVGQVIGVVTLPVISRLYTPAALGQFALLSSLSTVLTLVTTLGLASAVMAAEENDAAAQLVKVALMCSVILATVLTLAVIALGSVLPPHIAGLPLWQLCVWLYAMTIVNSALALLRVHTNRRGQNRTLAVNSVLSGLCTLAIAVPLGLLDHGALGLILSSIAAGTVCSLQMAWRSNPFRCRITMSSLLATLREHRSYILFQYPATLMEATGAQLPTQVLGGLYGSTQLGAYSMNERLLGVPLRLVGAPLGVVYFRSTSEYFRSGRSLGPLTFSIVSKLTLAASPPMVVLIFLGPKVFGWALGPEWREAGVLSSLLVPLYVLTLCRTAVNNCRVVIGRHRTNAGFSAARLGVVLLSLIVGHAWFGTLTGTVFSLTVGSSLFMVLDMATTFTVLGSHLRQYLILVLAFGVAVASAWFISGTFSRLS